MEHLGGEEQQHQPRSVLFTENMNSKSKNLPSGEDIGSHDFWGQGSRDVDLESWDSVQSSLERVLL